jgi:hypothetical protein
MDAERQSKGSGADVVFNATRAPTSMDIWTECRTVIIRNA